MEVVFDAVFPVFALIGLGYFCARRKILGPAATDSLNLFVVWLALPALLFQAMAEISFTEIDHPGFVLAFTGGMMAIFAISFLFGRGAGTQLADRSIEGLGAAYANTGFMGIPLCITALGAGSLVPAVIGTILTACILFAGAIVLIEIDLGEDRRLGVTVKKVGLSLSKNPLLAAPALGLIAAILQALLHFKLPVPITHFTGLLGAAASPCALVTIGLFLAQSAAADDGWLVARLVVLKLILHPAITALLAFDVFAMPVLWAHTAIILSALPTGTGPFMLAKYYNREAVVTSQAIMISTVLSLISVSALLAWWQ